MKSLVISGVASGWHGWTMSKDPDLKGPRETERKKGKKRGKEKEKKKKQRGKKEKRKEKRKEKERRHFSNTQMLTQYNIYIPISLSS